MSQSNVHVLWFLSPTAMIYASMLPNKMISTIGVVLLRVALHARIPKKRKKKRSNSDNLEIFRRMLHNCDKICTRVNLTSLIFLVVKIP